MSHFRDKFDRKHEAAVAALLTTTSVQAAAQQSGVSARTLRRWLERDDFQAAYRRAKRELINGAVHTLLHATESATQVLISIMQDPEQPASARVAAARAVLNMVMHALRDEDLDGRFTAIEQRLAEVNGHHG
jgi:hypothetical protein